MKNITDTSVIIAMPSFRVLLDFVYVSYLMDTVYPWHYSHKHIYNPIRLLFF